MNEIERPDEKVLYVWRAEVLASWGILFAIALTVTILAITVAGAAAWVLAFAAIPLVFGALAAVVCYGAIQLVKVRLRLDDSLDVFAVHGVGGMLGSILLAIFLAEGLGGTGYAQGFGMGSMLGVQVLAVAAVAIYSAVATALIALAVSLFLPMRVSEDEERQGLDIADHGERGWEFD